MQKNSVVSVEKDGDQMVLTDINGEVKKIQMTDAVNEKFNFADKLVGVYRSDEDVSVGLANFHLHTGFSLLDGGIKIDELASLAASDRDLYPQVIAITDHGSMSGTYKFCQSLEKEKLIPIIGCEVYCESLGGEKDNNHLILLCKNDIGYHNLCKILSKAEENFHRHANVTWDNLRLHHEGLVCLSACLGGEVARKIINKDTDESTPEEHVNPDQAVLDVIENFFDIFGEDFYLEIQNHGIKEELAVTAKIVQLSKEMGIKIVSTTDAHYLMKNHSKYHEILLCIGTKKKLSDETRFAFKGENYHFLSNDEFFESFKNVRESLNNMAEVAMKCQFRFKVQDIIMPIFEVEDTTTPAEEFVRLCNEGFNTRFPVGSNINYDEYRERLKYELSIISQMNFESYFLIVADFISWARERGIAIGPGRGSAVGSLASYCLGITNLDPIPYGLLFERFLNPERISWPDIDVDIQDSRRGEVIEYVKNKYGDECVSRIITFGTLAARAVIRDVGNVLEIPPNELSKVMSLIPIEVKMTIKKALKGAELKGLYNSNSQIKYLLDAAMVMEGLPRHKSQHACGVVISAQPISNVVPEVILEDSKGNSARTAVFTMNELEELGLLKMDFLGLRNLGIIAGCCQDLNISENSIPLDDPYVYALLATGDTDGIFQVESGGMKNLMKDMFVDVPSRIEAIKLDKIKMKAFGAECFERLIAAISLYRPGPMDYIPDYIRGMRDPSSIHYDTPKLEPILSKTYGTIVYQEQVQQIVRDLAGYSLGRGDTIRRAMGKKKTSIMDKEKEIFLNGNKAAFDAGKDSKFVPGCIANGVPAEAATIIWDKMAQFALYAFNKSHAAGYAVISVQTTWLKLYHKTSFWNHTLNSVITDADAIKKYIASAKTHGIKILSPDVNNSGLAFSVEGPNQIRMGLQSLRNLGKTAIPLIEERNTNGTFKSIDDFIYRLVPEKKMLESLVFSGALDSFKGTRRAKNMIHDDIAKYRKDNRDSTMPFTIPELEAWFDSVYSIEIQDVSEMDEDDKLEMEYIYAGMYVTKHPLERFAKILNFKPRNIADLVVDMDESDESTSMPTEIDERVTVIGIIKEVETKSTKNGKQMKIFSIEDTTGTIKGTAFSNTLEDIGDVLMNNALVKIDGQWQVNDFGSQIIIRSMVNLASSFKTDDRYYNVTCSSGNNLNEILTTIDELEKNNLKKGNLIPVVIEVQSKDANYLIYKKSLGTKKRALDLNAFTAMMLPDVVQLPSDEFSQIQLKEKLQISIKNGLFQ